MSIETRYYCASRSGNSEDDDFLTVEAAKFRDAPVVNISAVYGGGGSIEVMLPLNEAHEAAALAEANDLLRWMGSVHILPDAEALPTDEPFGYPALLERVDRLRALVAALQGVA